MLGTSSDNSTAPRRVGYSLAVGSCSGPHHTTHMMTHAEYVLEVADLLAQLESGEVTVDDIMAEARDACSFVLD